MYFKNITIDCFRNIQNSSLELSPHFNIFYGDNGAGKTSILEALYYIGMGKSFRTHLASRVIQNDQHSLKITAKINDNDASSHFIGLERHRNGERIIKLDREMQVSIAPILQLLPLQLLSVDSYRYFSDSPKGRRSFLDWGVFHMKQNFLELWQSYNRILKQRNSALRHGLTKSEVIIWDNEFIELSQSIDLFRSQYLEAFKPIYQNIFFKLLPKFKTCDIRYKRGWAKDRGLKDILEEHYSRDFALGYTSSGPHRSDLQLYINKYPADDVLSQGQLKLAAYALHLSQGILLKQQLNKSPIYLIDDLPSELDPEKQMLIIEIIKELSAQVFITGIVIDTLQDLAVEEGAKVFHVKQGQVIQALSAENILPL